MKKITAKDLVAQNAEALSGMSNAELFQFRRDHGMASAAGFSLIK